MNTEDYKNAAIVLNDFVIGLKERQWLINNITGKEKEGSIIELFNFGNTNYYTILRKDNVLENL